MYVFPKRPCYEDCQGNIKSLLLIPKPKKNDISNADSILKDTLYEPAHRARVVMIPSGPLCVRTCAHDH